MPDADLTKRILRAADDGFDDEVALSIRPSPATIIPSISC